MRRALASAAAAVFALALVGCGEKPEPRLVDPPRKDDGTLIRELLDARAQRLPQTRRVRELGVRSITYEVADGASIDGDRARLPVRVSYRVRSISGRFTAKQTLTAARTRGDWRIARRAGTRQRPPWEVAGFERRRTRHFVILAPPGDDGTLDQALETAYAQMREVLRSGTLERRYLVQVARDAGQARALTASIRGLRTLTAITDTEVREAGPAQRVARVVSQRLIVIRPNFLRADAESRVTVLAHELAHAVLADATSGRTPAWLTEGVALYVSGDPRVREAAEVSTALTALSAPDAIGRLGGDEQGGAYAYSSAAAFYIAERFGRKRLLDLYEAFNDEALVGEAGDPRLTDRAVRQELRIPLARLERDLRRWIVARAVAAPFGP